MTNLHLKVAYNCCCPIYIALRSSISRGSVRVLIILVNSSNMSANIGKCMWRSGWYLALNSRMAVLQHHSGSNTAATSDNSHQAVAAGDRSVSYARHRHSKPVRNQHYLLFLPGCICMISSSLMRTVSSNSSLILWMTLTHATVPGRCSRR